MITDHLLENKIKKQNLQKITKKVKNVSRKYRAAIRNGRRRFIF